MRHTGAEILINLLELQGIDTIFGIPGGSNLPIYDALHKSKKIRHILTRHEQGAGFMAQGISRSTGKPAVCFATSGPGVTNLLTAVADAKLDSVPIIAITGQVSSTLIGTDAFQEVDTYGMSMPITKHNFLVRSAVDLFEIIPEAFRIATSGRPGPVLIDIPKDVQIAQVIFESYPEPQECSARPAIDTEAIRNAIEMIANAQCPALYIGGGIVHSNASFYVQELAHKNNIPVASTLMGLGVMEHSDPLFLGMLGMHGARSTNTVLHECDLLLAFGVRFDDRATGKVSQFCANAKIIHADIDRSEFGKIKKPDFTIEGDIGDILKSLVSSVPENNRPAWMERVATIKQLYPAVPNSKDPFDPANILLSVNSLVDSDTIISTDVGQHQMWVAQVYPFSRPRTLLTSGGLGTMGFGLPAAIGAAYANPDKKVVCFTGDGSLLMNIQELATLADLNLNLSVILFNNGHLGLVRQQQELFYNQNFIASRFTKNPDFITIAEGFGIQSYNLASTEDPVSMLAKALSEKGPCLINIPIQHSLNVLPMVPPGAANVDSIGG